MKSLDNQTFNASTDNPLNIDLTAINLFNWDVGPANRWTYRNIDKVLNVVPIPKGDGPTCDFIENVQDLMEVSFERIDGVSTSLISHLKNSYTDGFLVLHEGRLVTEVYFDGMLPESLHLSQSVCKSVVGVLAGILVKLGLIDVQKLVTEYIPELEKSGYADSIIRHLLDMRTGVFYEEDYDNPSREYQLMDQYAGWKEKTFQTHQKITINSSHLSN